MRFPSDLPSQRVIIDEPCLLKACVAEVRRQILCHLENTASKRLVGTTEAA